MDLCENVSSSDNSCFLSTAQASHSPMVPAIQTEYLLSRSQHAFSAHYGFTTSRIRPEKKMQTGMEDPHWRLYRSSSVYLEFFRRSGETSIDFDAYQGETASHRHRTTARRVVYKHTTAVFDRSAPSPSSLSDEWVALHPLASRNPLTLLSMSPNESLSDQSGRDPKLNTNVNVKLANPLAGISQEKLIADATAFAFKYGLGHLQSEFQKGALVAQDPTAFDSIPLLSDDDKAILRRELTHRWSQPWQLYYLVILCSLAAAVQGVCR